MKRILIVLLVLLLALPLVGCKDEKVDPSSGAIAGGFVEVEDGTLTEELKEMFNKATSDLTGASYEPVKLIATQVVAGINYKFLANGKKMTNPITEGTYFVTIYKDLEGNVSLLNIESADTISE